MKKINIAIDGHSSTGKSTVAKDLAKALGYKYIDTGAMYRAVTYYAMTHGLFKDGKPCKERLIREMDRLTIDFKYNPETGQSETWLNGKNIEKAIRQMNVSEKVSLIAAIPEVRKKLVELQQKMARQKGVVMDGRDIGSVVMPDAELKIFMTASPEVRATRRFKELQAVNPDITFDEVRKNVLLRDKIDSERKASPLIKTEDARLLDNSNMSKSEQLDLILRWVKEITGEN